MSYNSCRVGTPPPAHHKPPSYLAGGLCYNAFMDVVYILGSGSLVSNKEIKYSLRALETNMQDIRNVYVIGELVPDLPGVIHIPATDPAKTKWQNAYLKIKKACSLPDLSEEFLLMNDDFFMLEPFIGTEWPFYALKNSNGGVCGQHSFQIHCPIRLNKEWYSKMPFDVHSKGHLSPRTFYANFYKAPPLFCTDFIVRVGKEARNYDEQIKNWPCFSIGDVAMLDPVFSKWLEDMYPVPSRFEKL